MYTLHQITQSLSWLQSLSRLPHPISQWHHACFNAKAQVKDPGCEEGKNIGPCHELQHTHAWAFGEVRRSSDMPSFHSSCPKQWVIDANYCGYAIAALCEGEPPPSSDGGHQITRDGSLGLQFSQPDAQSPSSFSTCPRLENDEQDSSKLVGGRVDRISRGYHSKYSCTVSTSGQHSAHRRRRVCC